MLEKKFLILGTVLFLAACSLPHDLSTSSGSDDVKSNISFLGYPEKDLKSVQTPLRFTDEVGPITFSWSHAKIQLTVPKMITVYAQIFMPDSGTGLIGQWKKCATTFEVNAGVAANFITEIREYPLCALTKEQKVCGAPDPTKVTILESETATLQVFKDPTCGNPAVFFCQEEQQDSLGRMIKMLITSSVMQNCLNNISQPAHSIL